MAVVAILAIGVLIGINPIEQINKAKDGSNTQMANQLLSALQRYYIGYGDYPWPITHPWVYAYHMNYLGLVANDGNNNDGKLVTSGELKSSFRNKAFNDKNLFGGISRNTAGLNPKYTNALLTCYIPDSKSARGDFSLGESEYSGFVYQKLIASQWGYLFHTDTPSLDDCDEDSEWEITNVEDEHFCALCIYE
jgi:type II secretory pathway pseudopilin PulG